MSYELRKSSHAVATLCITQAIAQLTDNASHNTERREVRDYFSNIINNLAPCGHSRQVKGKRIVNQGFN